MIFFVNAIAYKKLFSSPIFQPSQPPRLLRYAAILLLAIASAEAGTLQPALHPPQDRYPVHLLTSG